VAHRPDGIQTARSLAESFRQRIQEISIEKITQPSCSVCVPGGGVLRILGQVISLGVVPRSTRR